MIADISFWKHEISNLADDIKSAVLEMESLEIDLDSQEFFAELASCNFKLERALFFSALAIRRIFEADCSTRKYKPNQEEWHARTVSRKLKSRNYHFELVKDDQHNNQFSIKSIVKEIIHSEYLSWADGEGTNVEGFQIASENNRSRGPFLIKWTDYYSMIELIVNDQPDPFEEK